jgi:hypothetical protein
MKRKIKVWGKLRLYETSAVGIPAYPDAHASFSSFSLIKSISNASLKTRFTGETEDIDDELNLNGGKGETMEEETKSQKSENVEIVKTIETKQIDVSEIVKAIKEALKDGLKELENERGLVEKQEPQKKLSLGEMAIKQGLFVK